MHSNNGSSQDRNLALTVLYVPSSLDSDYGGGLRVEECTVAAGQRRRSRRTGGGRRSRSARRGDATGPAAGREGGNFNGFQDLCQKNGTSQALTVLGVFALRGRVSGTGLGIGIRVQGLGFRVEGLGFRV